MQANEVVIILLADKFLVFSCKAQQCYVLSSVLIILKKSLENKTIPFKEHNVLFSKFNIVRKTQYQRHIIPVMMNIKFIPIATGPTIIHG